MKNNTKNRPNNDDGKIKPNVIRTVNNHWIKKHKIESPDRIENNLRWNHEYKIKVRWSKWKCQLLTVLKWFRIKCEAN